MKKKLKILAIFTLLSILLGCTSRQANLNRNKKISKNQNYITVFPFRNAYYKGKELIGVGTAISSIFTFEVIGTGRKCRLVDSEDFRETKEVDVDKACKYAKKQGADVAIIGAVNEWIDGATQWSGRADVVSVSVFAYDPTTCSLITSASGREQGRRLALVNAPVTRFYKTLLKELVAAMFD